MPEIQQKIFSRNNFIPAFISVIAFIILLYFTERENSFSVIAIFSALFLCYYLLIRNKINWLHAVFLGIIFRLIALFSFPELSDDIYRFIWDGNLMTAGLNPYLYLPQDISAEFETGFMQSIFASMNSPSYYTVYPPLCQFVFSAGSLLGYEDIYLSSLFIKTFIFIAECATMLLLVRLLETNNLDKNHIAWYALNPLVIIELCGNAHFEGLMIFYLLLGIYFIQQNKIVFAGLSLGFAISVKLLPILIIPFLPKYFGWKKSILISSIIAITTLILFLPFIDSQLLNRFSSSLDLYFRTFEFNASIYNLVKHITISIQGYNRIDIIGPVLAGITTISILILAFFSRLKTDPISGLIAALSIYFFLGTTVHPWYITTLCALAVLRRADYVFLWSGLIILSYVTYGNTEYQENYFLIAIEYLAVFSALIYQRFAGLRSWGL